MNRMSKLGSFSVLVAALCLTAASCNKSADQSAPQDANADPAQANLAPAAAQPQAPAPAAQAPATQAQTSYPSQPSYQNNDEYYADETADNDPSEPPVQAEQPPPPIPEYTQPPCPGENYMWTPGNWEYASAGYYWVPGAWVVAPYVGALWTPPYWSFASGRYHWRHGYWGAHVGFYGGINYGAGYVGRGYEGGYWNKGQFAYNRSVNNVNTTVVHNVYDYRVTNITNVRVSYDGGRGGLDARPTPAELAVLREPRIAPLPAQVQHMRQAEANRGQFVAANHGHVETLAAPHPLATAYRAPAPHPGAVPGARALPPIKMPAYAPAQQPRAQEQPNQRRPNQPAQERTNPVPHGAPPVNRPALESHPENRPTPQPRAEPGRPTPQPRAEPRSAPVPRSEPRPAPQPREEPRRAPEPRAEPRSAAAPRAEPRPAPQAHVAQKPAPKPEPKRKEEHEPAHEPHA